MHSKLDRFNELTLKLHELQRLRLDHSREADAIRDEGDRLWHAMTESERARAREHSARLDAGADG